MFTKGDPLTQVSISSCWIQIATTFADSKTESDSNVSLQATGNVKTNRRMSRRVAQHPFLFFIRTYRNH